MGQHLDALGGREPLEHLLRPREPVDVAFVVDPFDVEQPVGEFGGHPAGVLSHRGHTCSTFDGS